MSRRPGGVGSLGALGGAWRLFLLLGLQFTSLGLLASMAFPGPVAGIAFVLLATAFPVLLMGLGALRSGSRTRGLGSLAVVLALLFVVLEGSMVTLLILRGRVLEVPWALGLPTAALVQVAGLCLIPLLLVGLAYGLTFPRRGLSAEDLASLRRRFGSGPEEEDDEEPQKEGPEDAGPPARGEAEPGSEAEATSAGEET